MQRIGHANGVVTYTFESLAGLPLSCPRQHPARRRQPGAVEHAQLQRAEGRHA